MASGGKVPRDPNISGELRAFLDDLARAQLNNNYTATSAPGVTNDANSNYSVGSVWINLTADDAYICCDATAGAAVWKKTTP